MRYALSGIAAIGAASIFRHLIKKTPENSLEKKKLNIVVTGGSSGFGLALVREFLKQGHRVATCSRSTPPTEIVKHPNCLWMKCDLNSLEDCNIFFDYITNTLGNIDLFVNNVGSSATSITSKFGELKSSDMHQIINLDLRVAMHFTHLLIPVLLKQDNGGHIVFVQGLGEDGRKQSGFTGIGTMKHGLRYFADSLALEYKNTKVGFHSVNPGMIVTSQDFAKMLDLAWVANILADTPGNAARCLVPMMTSLSGTGSSFQRISAIRIILGFLISPVYRKKLVDESTGKVLVDVN